MSLFSEIYEQPQRLEELIIHQYNQIKQVAQVIKQKEIQMVLLAARGTSDNAGRYANYLLGNRQSPARGFSGSLPVHKLSNASKTA